MIKILDFQCLSLYEIAIMNLLIKFKMFSVGSK